MFLHVEKCVKLSFILRLFVAVLLRPWCASLRCSSLRLLFWSTPVWCWNRRCPSAIHCSSLQGGQTNLWRKAGNLTCGGVRYFNRSHPCTMYMSTVYWLMSCPWSCLGGYGSSPACSWHLVCHSQLPLQSLPACISKRYHGLPWMYIFKHIHFNNIRVV